MGKYVDLSDVRFGRLTVTGQSPRTLLGKGRIYWECECDCGNVTTATTNDLRSGNTTSCGCAKKERFRRLIFRDGRCKSRTYGIFRAMHSRCESKGHRFYKYYGGRGIKVCAHWSGRDGYQNFLADMGEAPEGLTIERIDVNGDYSLANCRWATMDEQRMNKRNTRRVTWQGQTRSLTEWARIGNKPVSWLRYRLETLPLATAMDLLLNG